MDSDIFFSDEKKTGISSPDREPEVVIPSKWEPFSVSHLFALDQAICGQRVFEDGSWPIDLWKSRTGHRMKDMTCGFDENLVKMWGGDESLPPGRNTEEGVLFDEDDPVFKTVAGKDMVLV